MKEALLQYAWQHKLFYHNDLCTTNGCPLEVIDTGRLNSDAGPDFFNAKVKIEDTLWAGNVEVHLRSSDWFRHHHDQDNRYQSVILHVVTDCDAVIKRPDGEEIPQLILPLFIDLEEKYALLLQQKPFVACSHMIDKVHPVLLHGWLNALMIERLEQKSSQIEDILQYTGYDWEESFYILLTRNFGLHLNGDSFEQLAKSLPHNILGKHKNNLLQIEALLFGQSGLLDILPEIPGDDAYMKDLQRESLFLRKKYALKPLDGHLWNMLRLRPVNFPTVRIAQLAALIHQSSKLFSKLLENQKINYISSLFCCEPSNYWQTHYSFCHTSRASKKPLGDKTISLLIINTVIPFLFLYGKHKDNLCLQENALELLEKIPAERNHILDGWKALNIKVVSSFDSQALIQLKMNYCDLKKCLQCRIGHVVLTNDRNYLQE
ncbi:DUF2851 family protein [Microbacter margulisiae]|uniref:DUF2851 family protein n=1 Tax=Microbacter margulisiae TaxID=1350067 RepID=A0A7W5H1K3_9PORP|nr:DUF2851 family protein [Microbacter margulisiae]MBB3186467.1 hypothetical protein [Microbacter margulisiae]